jgi:transcriptional regulator with XRE-family HTH domain
MPKRRKALWKRFAGNSPGWFVSEWLLYKGLKQKDLVARTDFSKGEVSDWVKGKERWNRDVLYAFADAIGVDAASLLRPPPVSQIDDEFSKFVVGLDQAAKRRLLRLWDVVEGQSDGDTKAA